MTEYPTMPPLRMSPEELLLLLVLWGLALLVYLFFKIWGWRNAPESLTTEEILEHR